MPGEDSQDQGAAAVPLVLGEREAAILLLEQRFWARSAPTSAGPKEAAIRAELGITPTRYYQLLNGLLDTERALASYPVMVNRLRAVRDDRRTARQ
ncbi:DUF3263 domain-containing protein [Kitasatospora sp. NBC_00240]|uniref:DUF3263 domain-containing protein n=1 Tax=Kitasatospora sp. NBC_00240 TaxID=2903567 RepID=UPI00224D6733|nr:DUF3263 domain-containing protein [Kitasatospora sp. NBC_00240]MCX5215656.1 DUF3263 domain-containing protein [Kitasatospora sp. NBC_00240]